MDSVIGFLTAVGVAFLAYRAHVLSLSGAIAAALLGTIVFGLGGVGWAIIMLTFLYPQAVSQNFLQLKKVIPV